MNLAAKMPVVRSAVVERLLGDTAEPERVIEAAAALGERVSGPVAEELNGRLAHPVEISVAEVTVARFAEALPSAASFDAICVASSSTSPDALTLIADPAAISIIVSAALGGDAASACWAIERDLSDIELALTAEFFNIAARCFNGSGGRALDIRFPLPVPVTGAGIPRMPRRDGPAVRIDFKIATPAAAGRIAALMPQRVLLGQRGDAAQSASEPKLARQWRERFSEEVMRSAVTLEATVPLARATLGEIASWQVGQVIALPENAQGQTRLSARRKTIFICEFGKLGNHYTLRVRQPFDAGRDFLDGLVGGKGGAVRPEMR